jgi:hypothetical protein
MPDRYGHRLFEWQSTVWYVAVLKGMVVSDMSGELMQSIRVPERMIVGVAGGRRILHAPDFPLVLLFTEKAGCTSLTKWFLFHIGKLDEATDYHPWVHRYRKNVLCQQRGYKQEAMRLLHWRKKP